MSPAKSKAVSPTYFAVIKVGVIGSGRRHGNTGKSEGEDEEGPFEARTKAWQQKKILWLEAAPEREVTLRAAGLASKAAAQRKTTAADVAAATPAMKPRLRACEATATAEKATSTVTSAGENKEEKKTGETSAEPAASTHIGPQTGEAAAAAEAAAGVASAERNSATAELELELELIRTQMAQKPVLWVEVHARALRASQNVKRAEVWWAGRRRH
jgi:hypothetical protein